MKRRFIEAPEGIGEVLLGDESLGTARYSLNVYQDVFESVSGGSEPGVPRISGRLWADFDSVLWRIHDNRGATLRLTDGRSLDFVDGGSGGEPNCAFIRNTSGFYRNDV